VKDGHDLAKKENKAERNKDEERVIISHAGKRFHVILHHPRLPVTNHLNTD
jgi:hypothetical protein